PAHRHHRAHRARQGRSQPGRPRRSLVCQLLARGGRDARRRAARPRERAADLGAPGGAMSYEDTLSTLAERNPDIVVLTAENRAAIRNLPQRLGPRFIDVGICEQTMIGMAAGLALRGRTPVVHALAAFLTMRAFEFIRTDVGIAGLPVKLVGYIPGFLSEANGPTHQAIEDIALMRCIPGLEIHCPADHADLARCLPDFVSSRAPAYLRFCAVDPVANRFTQGGDVGILTYGLLVREAVRAAELLAREGTSARVVPLRTLRPLDEAAVLAAAR